MFGHFWNNVVVGGGGVKVANNSHVLYNIFIWVASYCIICATAVFLVLFMIMKNTLNQLLYRVTYENQTVLKLTVLVHFLI